MKILDTSFLASLYLLQDSNHSKAKQQMDMEMETPLILAENILHETLTILSCRQDITLAKEVYLEMTQNTKVQIYHFTPLVSADQEFPNIADSVPASFAEPKQQQKI